MLLMKLPKKFFFILPSLQGEYRTKFERVYPCKSTNTFQTNLYFSKRTSSITEMKGNFTLLKLLDDSYSVSIYILIMIVIIIVYNYLIRWVS